MSRKSEAKERQGYEEKPLVKCCRTCGNLKSEKILDKWSQDHPDGTQYYHEKLSCALGDFAVKAQAVCKEWKEFEVIR